MNLFKKREWYEQISFCRNSLHAVIFAGALAALSSGEIAQANGDVITLPRLKIFLPATRRVAALNQDLAIQAVNGKARIVQDDQENTYDACFEEAGQKVYRFKP